MFLKKYLLRNDDAGADAGGGAGGDAGAAAAAAAGADTGTGTGGAAAAAAGAGADNAGAGSDKKGDWAENWRELMASGDEKELKQLGRYASPVEIWKKARGLEARMSSGELKPTLGKNPTADELKAWRAANGIPEEHTKYDLGDLKADGLAPEHLDLILKNAHGVNQTPDQVKATVSAAKAIMEDLQTKAYEKDANDQVTNEDALHGEWGAEFRRNINLINGLLDGQADQELKEGFLRARMPDGTLLGNHPGFMKMVLNLALIQNPTGTVVQGVGTDIGKGIKEELESIQKTMQTDRKAYNKDSKMQARFLELTDAAIARGLMDTNGAWK